MNGKGLKRVYNIFNPRKGKENRRQEFVKILLLLTILCLLSVYTNAQITVRGTVRDVTTNQPLAYVTIIAENTGIGGSTNGKGEFELSVPHQGVTLRFSLMGYGPVRKAIDHTHSDTLTVWLSELSETLDEVEVHIGKRRYRNRDNPAVDLIREAIAHKEKNRISTYRHISYEEYDKIQLTLRDVPKLLTNSPLLKRYQFAFEHTGTDSAGGRTLLPVYLEEQLTTKYRSANPAKQKDIVNARKKVEFDDRYIQNHNIEAFLRFLYRDMDIYDNDILILAKPFLSPVAPTAPLFYKYYITDTLARGTDSAAVSLSFEPRNPTDRLFRGKISISLDGNYAVTFAALSLGKEANLNWVNGLTIDFTFRKHTNGRYLPSRIDNHVSFGLSDGIRGALGWRTILFRKYDTVTGIPDSLLSGQQVVHHENGKEGIRYLEKNRPEPLSAMEANTYKNIDSLQRMKSFNRLLEWATFAAIGYKHIGPLELGPLEYSYSRNPVEGDRVRFGGRTTSQLSKQFYGEGYGAYGFGDRQMKFLLSGALSLVNRPIGHYPANYLQARVQRDLTTPGNVLEFVNGDSFTGLFRDNSRARWLRNELYSLEHFYEFGNHVRLETRVSNLRQAGTSTLNFIQSSPAADTVSGIQTSEIGVTWRWAPGELFFQRNLKRTATPNGAPVFSLQYDIGVKGLAGGQYDYHKLKLSAFQRFFLSQLGFADISLSGGHIWGTVPFPLLEIPTADQTYLVTPNSYNLMNDLEFISDKYITLRVDQRFQGFFLNKVPLLNKLGMRELVRFKLLYGGLRTENRPENNPSLLLFPLDREGRTATFSLEKQPYMEISLGLENILNIIRLEYIHRLSYLDHPDIRRQGLRFSVAFDF